MESIAAYLKGRVSIPELMVRPFRELHELYKIVYDRAEAQAKAEAEREKEEQEKQREEERIERSRKGLPPKIYREPPSDAKTITKTSTPMPSPYMTEDLEDVFEELIEGGV